jgi:hypothetical protein
MIVLLKTPKKLQKVMSKLVSKKIEELCSPNRRKSQPAFLEVRLP